MIRSIRHFSNGYSRWTICAITLLQRSLD